MPKKRDIRANTPVVITFTLSHSTIPLVNPQVIWYLYNPIFDTPLVNETINYNRTNAISRKSGEYEVTLPALPVNFIVKYQFQALSSEGETVRTPRPTDPFSFHAYFIGPTIGTIF